jgi:WD40 repeat protein
MANDGAADGPDEKTPVLEDLATPGGAGAGGAGGEPGRYQVGGEVARGGIGRIRRAVDQRLERPVAIKELLAPGGTTEARFHREARITARLQHPAIVPIYDMGRWPSGEPFYSMKLVAGRSLEAQVAATTSFRERIALLPSVITVAEAIAYAHRERVVHRDLKPANVLLGDFGETVVIDWGMARELDGPDEDAGGAGGAGADDAALTRAGAVVGTPAYMPPEQALGRPVDERADVYALGAILYHVLAGAPPYRGPSSQAVLAAVQGAPPRPLGERVPEVPPELAAIVAKAMARAPEERYPTAGALAEDLRRFQTGQLVGAHDYSVWALARRFVARHRAAVVVAAVLLAALAITLVVSFSRVVRERREAEAARVVAERQRAEADAQRREVQERENAGRLLQARAALARDPSLAAAWLRAWEPRAADLPVAAALAGEARGLGVALAVRPCGGLVGATTTVGFVPGRELVFAACEDGVHVAPARGGAGFVLAGERRIVDVVASADGAWLAMVDAGGGLARVRVDDAAGARRLDAFAANVAAVAVLASGELVSFDLAGGVTRWAWTEAAAPRALASGAAPGAPVDAGGAWILVQGDAGMALWDPARGTERALGAAALADLADDGSGVALVGAAGRVAWVDATSGARVELGAVADAVVVAAAPGGKHVAVAGADHRLSAWALGGAGAAAARALPGRGLGQRAAVMRFGPDGATLLVGTNLGDAVLVDLAGARAMRLVGPTGLARQVAFSADGALAAVLSEDGQVRVWPGRAAGGRRLGGSRPQRLAFDAAGQRLLAAELDGTVSVWDAARGERRALVGHAGAVESAAWSPDGARVASGGEDGTVRLWDAAEGTGRVVGRHPGGVKHVAWAADGARFASAGADGVVRLWSAEGAAAGELAGAAGGALWVAFSPDGATVAVAAADGGVALWEVATGAVRAALSGHGAAVLRVVYRPGGAQIATTGFDGTVRLWDAGGGPGRVLARRDTPCFDLVWSPDGGRLAASCWDGRVVVWEAQGDAVRVVGEHPGQVYDLAFTPDGRVLASAGSDGTVRLWALDGGRSLVLHVGDGAVRRVAVAPDGRTVAAAGQTLGVQLYDDPLGGAPPGDAEGFRRWLDEMTTVRVEDFGGPGR